MIPPTRTLIIPGHILPACTETGMDQYLLIPFLMGWTSIYQLFWCSPGLQGFDTLPNKNPGFFPWHWWCATADPGRLSLRAAALEAAAGGETPRTADAVAHHCVAALRLGALAVWGASFGVQPSLFWGNHSKEWSRVCESCVDIIGFYHFYPIFENSNSEHYDKTMDNHHLSLFAKIMIKMWSIRTKKIWKIPLKRRRIYQEKNEATNRAGKAELGSKNRGYTTHKRRDYD